MATLPRSTKYPPAPADPSFHRPVSDFDSGINTSVAWTEHLENASSSPLSLSKARSRRYLSESDAKPSLSEEEDDDDDEPEMMTRPARALYAFEGKPEFRELRVEAGDEFEVIKEDVGDGWSLVKDTTGEVGLLPQSYYTLTTELALSPDIQLDVDVDVAQRTKRREASGSSITPRGSPRSSAHQGSLTPLIPQHTGEWLPNFPSFRQSLLGGKSLNRFSSFVTSGAESFLLNGSPTPEATVEPTPISKPGHAKEDTSASLFEASEEERTRLAILGLGEADKHLIDAGPAGPAWHAKTPPLNVLVHSPSKRTSGLTGAYTMYSITSIFAPSPAQAAAAAEWVEVPDPDDVHPPSPTAISASSSASTGVGGDGKTRITVQRRFSHFVMLHTALSRRLPGIVLPPLPEKQYAGRFSHDFVEARRGDLERYLSKIVRHPVVRYAEALTFFLGCDNDSEWARLWPQHISAPAAGPAFYARVYHPAFNVDLEDAEEAINAFQNHARAVGKSVQGLRSVFGRIREARIEMSKAERLLSYSLLSLITSKPMAASSAPGTTRDEEDASGHSTTTAAAAEKMKGLNNSDGAWCWRENCADCLKLTKAVQKTSETLQTVANLYDGHARRTQLATHESLKLMAHPSSLYESVITTHKSTLSRYREAVGISNKSALTYANEDMAGRCETVLNTTMAEMDVYHTQKVEDLKTVATDHLDGEIAFYEQILTRLRTARKTFDDPQYTALAESPRLPSIYERDLSFDPANPQSFSGGSSGGGGGGGGMATRPLPQPCPHVFDSAPMRPVSVAIQEGVGMFLGEGGVGRASVFGRFW
ncbi:Sorting nexin-33 [Psilocybe cubensis]|uniref:Sorting nexin-33 n=2 Tax=Psilocybe cubensis TaxID=181762 RepID=A0ACB8GSL6_PSICU|nr:Sorting nexin-33 [Psilocybe cubensis]KAH9478454.1 Sorting nexin-33 [Psilocybe cubensis]